MNRIMSFDQMYWDFHAAKEEQLRQYIDQINPFQLSTMDFSVDFARQMSDKIDFGLWLFTVTNKEIQREFRDRKEESEYIHPD